MPPAPTIVPVPTREVEGVGDREAGATVAEGGYDTEFPGLCVTLVLPHCVEEPGDDGDTLPLSTPLPLLVGEPVGVTLCVEVCKDVADTDTVPEPKGVALVHKDPYGLEVSMAEADKVTTWVSVAELDLEAKGEGELVGLGRDEVLGKGEEVDSGEFVGVKEALGELEVVLDWVPDTLSKGEAEEVNVGAPDVLEKGVGEKERGEEGDRDTKGEGDRVCTMVALPLGKGLRVPLPVPDIERVPPPEAVVQGVAEGELVEVPVTNLSVAVAGVDWEAEGEGVKEFVGVGVKLLTPDPLAAELRVRVGDEVPVLEEERETLPALGLTPQLKVWVLDTRPLPVALAPEGVEDAVEGGLTVPAPVAEAVTEAVKLPEGLPVDDTVPSAAVKLVVGEAELVRVPLGHLDTEGLPVPEELTDTLLVRVGVVDRVAVPQEVGVPVEERVWLSVTVLQEDGLVVLLGGALLVELEVPDRVTSPVGESVLAREPVEQGEGDRVGVELPEWLTVMVVEGERVAWGLGEGVTVAVVTRGIETKQGCTARGK